MEEKQKKKKGKGLKIILGVIVVVIIIGVATSGKDDEAKLVAKEADSASSQETTTAEKTSFNVGETASLKDVLVTLVGVTESNGSKYNTPADGNVFLLCEFHIENNSTNDITVSSMMSFEAYVDDYATNISLTGLIEKGDKVQLDGSVAAGKKMNGVIAYEVPANWTNLEINFTPDFWADKDIKFIATK